LCDNLVDLRFSNRRVGLPNGDHWADVLTRFFADGRWLFTVGDNALLGLFARDGGLSINPLSGQPTQGPAHERAARILVWDAPPLSIWSPRASRLYSFGRVRDKRTNESDHPAAHRRTIVQLTHRTRYLSPLSGCTNGSRNDF
jgi:hypothetical protein